MSDLSPPEPINSRSATPRGKWELTQEAFDKFLASLDSDREVAGKKYLELRGNLIRLFEWRGCPFPEDHADETVNRLARKISEGELIREPSQYAIGVARYLVLEIQKERIRQQTAFNALANDEPATFEFEPVEPRAACLEQCLRKLPAKDRDLILLYYQGEKAQKIENRRRLTDRFNASLNTLRMRALRLREKLLACVETCLQKKR